MILIKNSIKKTKQKQNMYVKICVHLYDNNLKIINYNCKL